MIIIIIEISVNTENQKRVYRVLPRNKKGEGLFGKEQKKKRKTYPVFRLVWIIEGGGRNDWSVKFIRFVSIFITGLFNWTGKTKTLLNFG